MALANVQACLTLFCNVLRDINMDSCDSLDPTPEPIADESIERSKESESGLPSMLFDNMQSCFDLNYGTTHATKMDSYDSPSHTGDPTAKAAIDSDSIAGHFGDPYHRVGHTR